ncbi:hypothetical protein WOLCODRAFT_20602 [Wolfiporia cocos MD-104 SS10]|uniref:Uncharacterized protein n=1 Tax=Wolfiporia cocos (strain MD-104) TaxID=742152 RepID=A0A2H3JFR1_WOLCO|nr:hypothetical protein WOLCODRAFT_20602 [Wolfiporia cocos MD-104 SS10]
MARAFTRMFISISIGMKRKVLMRSLGNSLRNDHRFLEEPNPFWHNASQPHIVIASPTALSPQESAESVAVQADGPDDVKGGAPLRRWTQEDQDKTDDETRWRVLKELVRSWEDRLQLISVITTFFAATEAQLLGFAAPDDGDPSGGIRAAAAAVLLGALVMHLFAAFFLIRFRLSEAKRAEEKVERSDKAAEAGTAQGGRASSFAQLPIFHADPHIEQYGPFHRRKGPPDDLLENCHTLCIWLAAVGFLLALAGVLCYAWARLPRSSGIFSSVCMAVCFVAGFAAVLLSRINSR